MDLWINIAALAFLLSGVVVWLCALKFRTTEHPMTMFAVRNWIPVWKMKTWFTPKGFRLNLIGTILVSAGGLIGVLGNLLLDS